MNNNYNYLNNGTNNKSTNPLILIFSSLAVMAALLYLGYSIYDSLKNINMILEIINGVLIFLITICSVILFNKKKTILKIFTTIFIFLFCTINVGVNLKIINFPMQNFVPNFSHKSISEVLTWANDNKIDLTQIYEYSDTTDEYDVISQSIKENTLMEKMGAFTVVVSDGPNYNKDATITSMVGLNIDEAIKIIDDNYLSNVIVDFEKSEEDKDIVLSQSIAGTIKRSDEVKLVVSLGSGDLESVKLKNLTNLSLFKSTVYLKRNGLKYEINYSFSDTVKKGSVINTSPNKGTKVSPGDVIKLNISKGKEIIVPDLKAMNINDVTTFIIDNRLKMKYSDKYSSSVKKGKIISVNYTSGEKIAEGTVIEVVASKGKLKLPSFTSLSEFRAWAETYNISYEEEHIFSDSIKKGEIIKYSSNIGDVIDPDQTIKIYTSDGKAVKVPSLINKTKTTVSNLCNQNKLICTFSYSYSSSVSKGTSISQNKKEGTEVSEGTYINVVLSNGKAPTNSNKTNSNSTNSSNTPSTPSCDTSKGNSLNIQAGNSGNETKSMIEQLNPNHTFGWEMVSACSNGNTSPGTLCTTGLDGQWKSYCDTINISVVK